MRYLTASSVTRPPGRTAEAEAMSLMQAQPQLETVRIKTP
jgi:hypothetical protein